MSSQARPAFTPPFTEEELAVYSDVRGMPGDVQLFIIKWSDCAHWLGEPPFDDDRRRQIDQAFAAVCPGVDAMRADILRRHAGDTAVLERLKSYEMLDQ